MIETRIPLEDADVRLVSGFLPIAESTELLATLKKQSSWHQPEIRIFGKTVLSPRLAVWYGDGDAVYQYSGLINQPVPWTPALLAVRQQVSEHCQIGFNSVLLNYYRDGNDSMGWHSDDEAELGTDPVISSLSLGAERVFLLRHRQAKKQRSVRIPLQSGDLLVMAGQTQRFWKHSISKTTKAVGARINLTFRSIIAPEH